MDEGTRNSFLALLALATTIGNFLAFLWARHESAQQRKELQEQRREAKEAVAEQRKETRELADLASELEHRVHQLSVGLDHRILRLQRLREILAELTHISLSLRQKNRSHENKLDLAAKREVLIAEFMALGRIIDDDRLHELILPVLNVLTGAEHSNIWADMWNELPYDMGKADQLLRQLSDVGIEMHFRILQLLNMALEVNEKSIQKTQ